MLRSAAASATLEAAAGPLCGACSTGAASSPAFAAARAGSSTGGAGGATMLGTMPSSALRICPTDTRV
ncbi:MAG: hypothetical protein IPJ65_07165 [Archangiaceae bacterium]|nr:hypothetical protein [Archangiaceae bacterium]